MNHHLYIFIYSVGWTSRFKQFGNKSLFRKCLNVTQDICYVTLASDDDSQFEAPRIYFKYH